MWPQAATGVATCPPSLELTALLERTTGLQPEELPARQQLRSTHQPWTPQAGASAPWSILRPVNSLDTPLTPKTFVSRPPPSQTCADATSLQLEILIRSEPSAR
eukprot:2656481-Pyramimonas_sp.AAC.1